MQKLLAVDLSSVVYRACFAGDNPLRLSLHWIHNCLDTLAPTRVALVMDGPGETFRHHLFAGYKARSKIEPEQRAQIKATISDVSLAMGQLGIVTLGAPGWEADDVIATLVHKVPGPAFIATKDKDFCQLVDERVKLFDFKSCEIRDQHYVFKKFGVWPNQFVDYLALVGDASDGFPGCRGVGPDGAERLLAELTLDEAIDEIDSGRTRRLTGKLTRARRALERERPMVELSRTLARLRVDAPLPWSPGKQQ